MGNMKNWPELFVDPKAKSSGSIIMFAKALSSYYNDSTKLNNYCSLLKCVAIKIKHALDNLCLNTLLCSLLFEGRILVWIAGVCGPPANSYNEHEARV